MSGERKFAIENQSHLFFTSVWRAKIAIISVIFNGKNYDLWKKAVRTVLKSKNKLGFIEGTLAKPKPKEGKDQSKLIA